MATLINLKRGTGLYNIDKETWTSDNASIGSAEPWVNLSTKQLWVGEMPINVELKLTTAAGGTALSDILLDNDGKAYRTLNISPSSGTGYTLPRATTTDLGGIKLGSDTVVNTIINEEATSGDYYPLQVDSEGKAAVRVPTSSGSATDTNTVYTIQVSPFALTGTTWEEGHEPRIGEAGTVDNNPIALIGSDDSVVALEHAQTQLVTIGEDNYEVGSVVKYYRPGSSSDIPIIQDIRVIDGGVFGGQNNRIADVISGATVFTEGSSGMLYATAKDEDNIVCVVNTGVSNRSAITFTSAISKTPEKVLVGNRNIADAVYVIPSVGESVVVDVSSADQLRIGFVWAQLKIDSQTGEVREDVLGPTTIATIGNSIAEAIINAGTENNLAKSGFVPIDHSGQEYKIYYSLSADAINYSGDYYGYTCDYIMPNPDFTPQEGEDKVWYRFYNVVVGASNLPSDGIVTDRIPFRFIEPSALLRYYAGEFDYS